MRYTFPANFSFGVSDADLQVIGENYTQKFEFSEPTLWQVFAKTSGKVFQNQTPGVGVNRYGNWFEDIEIMKNMGIKEYRTSVSMARTLLKDGSVNKRALEWYERYLRALRNAGITISVTLYHWELPYFLQEEGGWLNTKTIEWFLKHVSTVAENLGEFIHEYFILNEPWCSSFVGYYFGEHAPGEQNLSHALQVAHHLLLAQGLAYKKLQEIDAHCKISTVVNVTSAYPASEDMKDRQATRYCDGFFNRWFLDPIFFGVYPQDMLELFQAYLPSYTPEEMKIIHIGQGFYALGINYYHGSIVKYNAKNDLQFDRVNNPKGEKNDLGWPIYLPPHYPEGLCDILVALYNRYQNYGLKKLYVTENGIPLHTPWDGISKTVDDKKRVEFLAGHLLQVYRAIAQGIPVEKFFVWTFMDNFEWGEGYRPEASFGLIHIERPSLQRVWKESAHWYKHIMKTHTLEVGERFE